MSGSETGGISGNLASILQGLGAGSQLQRLNGSSRRVDTGAAGGAGTTGVAAVPEETRGKLVDSNTPETMLQQFKTGMQSLGADYRQGLDTLQSEYGQAMRSALQQGAASTSGNGADQATQTNDALSAINDRFARQADELMSSHTSQTQAMMESYGKSLTAWANSHSATSSAQATATAGEDLKSNPQYQLLLDQGKAMLSQANTVSQGPLSKLGG